MGNCYRALCSVPLRSAPLRCSGPARIKTRNVEPWNEMLKSPNGGELCETSSWCWWEFQTPDSLVIKPISRISVVPPGKGASALKVKLFSYLTTLEELWRAFLTWVVCTVHLIFRSPICRYGWARATFSRDVLLNRCFLKHHSVILRELSSSSSPWMLTVSKLSYGVY